jgi:hypothetical protein
LREIRRKRGRLREIRRKGGWRGEEIRRDEREGGKREGKRDKKREN